MGKIHYLNIPKRNWRGLLVNEDGRPLKERDQPAHEVGYLIYLKPSITGDEPNDVTEYGALVPAFPHESTADQWFSESQFEAYRKLGMHVAEQSFCRFPAVVDEIDQLFERLYKFWYPPTLAVGAHSTEHTKTYSEIMEVIRTSPRLVGIDHAVFEGLPPGGTPPLDPRDEFYICTALIQLIEDVYADLDLELNWDHPHVEGWMAVFRRWARQEAFRRTWALSRTTYAERFRLFYNDRLIHHRNGLRPLSLPRNFVAAHRGLWNHVEAAQNTLPAFHDAIEAGAHLVEMDVRRLQDGTLVVYHDADVARELLSGLTALAFQAAVNTMTAQKGWAPTQLLTLDECLRDLYGRRIALNIELKDPGIEADVLRIIHDTAWAPEDLLLTSFHPGMLENIRAIRDDIQTGLLIDGPIDVARARALAGVDVDCIAPEDTPLSTDVLDAFAADGIAVVPWNVTTQRLQFVLCHPATVGLTTDNVVEALRVRKQIR